MSDTQENKWGVFKGKCLGCGLLLTTVKPCDSEGYSNYQTHDFCINCDDTDEITKTQLIQALMILKNHRKPYILKSIADDLAEALETLMDHPDGGTYRIQRNNPKAIKARAALERYKEGK